MVRMCSSNELDVDQDLPIVPGRATGTEVGLCYIIQTAMLHYIPYLITNRFACLHQIVISHLIFTVFLFCYLLTTSCNSFSVTLLSILL